MRFFPAHSFFPATTSSRSATAVAAKEPQPRARSMVLSVLGDNGAGKSTLIMTLVSKQFPPVVPSVVPQICVTPEPPDYKVAVRLDNIFIRDCKLQGDADFAAMREQLSSTDGVIIVHALDDVGSFERVKSFWLPQVASAFNGPVVVCGNKSDLVHGNGAAGSNGGTEGDLEARVRPLVESFPQVDSCVEVSALDLASVENLFFLAQHSVMYPVPPLFDVKARKLTAAFDAAITRVFRFFDRDGDGALSDAELNNFQEYSFDARLPVVDLEGLKAVLSREAPGFVSDAGVTLDGLKFLFQLFIRRGLPESSWQVLHRFGYNDALEFVMPAHLFPRDQAVELSRKAVEFLTKVLQEFDTDHDGALAMTDIAQALCGFPDGRKPWTEAASSSSRALSDLSDFPQGCLTNRNGHLTLAGWLGFWHMLTLMHPAASLRFLMLLSYPEEAASALRTLPKDSPQRQVLRVFVFGARGVGKSGLLDALVRKSGRAASADVARSVVAAVRHLQSDRPASLLVLTEVPTALAHNAEALDGLVDCDLAVMLFDATDASSVAFLERVQAKVPSRVPCVYWGNKQDLVAANSVAAQRAAEAGEALTKAYSLPAPAYVKLRAPEDGKAWQDADRRFALLLETARYPKAAQPVTAEQKRAMQAQRWRRMALRLSFVSVALAAASYAGVVLFKRTAAALPGSSAAASSSSPADSSPMVVNATLRTL